MSLFTPGSLLSRVEALEALKEGPPYGAASRCRGGSGGVVFTPGSLLDSEVFLKGGTKVAVREEVADSRERAGQESGGRKESRGGWRGWKARFGKREGWVRWDEGRFGR